MWSAQSTGKNPDPDVDTEAFAVVIAAPIWQFGNPTAFHDAPVSPVSIPRASTAEDITIRAGVNAPDRALFDDFERLFSLSMDALAVCDGEGRFLRVSPAWTVLLGWTEEEMINNSCSGLVHPDDVTATEAARAALLRDGVLHGFENRYRARDGTYRWLSWQATYNREKGNYICAARDITSHREALEALRASEQRMNLVFGAVAEGVVVKDAAGRMVSCNAAAENILGLTAAQIVGSTPMHPQWRTIHEDGSHFPAHEHPSMKALETGRPVRDVVMGVYRPDGSLRWIVVNCVPLKDGAGRVQMVVSSFADVTARKALEERLRQAQKMEVVGQLAGGVAHDFNNILTSMKLNLALVRNEVTAPDGLRYVGDLDALAERAAKFTEQLLLFARRKRLQAVTLDLNGVVVRLGDLLRRLLGERIRIEVHTAHEPVWVDADTDMLDQAVMNLSVNARDAMPQGGTLTLSTGVVALDEQTAARLPEARAGEFACLSVADTGIGMPPEVCARVFEPFFTTKEVGRGTGLGLPSVHGMVHQLNGWISVESAVGRGTVFRVYLPRARILRPKRTRPPAAPRPTGHNETILLVEDEQPLREAATVMLQRLGYRVSPAADAREALAVWEGAGGAFDLLFSDIVMPGGINGIQLAELLQDRLPTLRVLLTSGYSDEIGRAEASARGDTAFLAKPFDSASLARAVRACLAHTSGRG